MTSRIIALALVASLTSVAAASAATPPCAHSRAAPAPANPKDVFRRSLWVCDHSHAGTRTAARAARPAS